MADELRTFIAVELDDLLRQSLLAQQARFKKQMPPGSVKWVAPEGMHLTLKFLGDTPPQRIPDIVAALRDACATFAPFELTFEGRGCFPSINKPRVVWAAVRAPGNALVRLQRAVEEYIAPLGWPPEARGFTPHLTLGRVARDADARAVAKVGAVVENSIVEELGRQRVEWINLIRSELRPRGAIYTTLDEVMLTAP